MNSGPPVPLLFASEMLLAGSGIGLAPPTLIAAAASASLGRPQSHPPDEIAGVVRPDAVGDVADDVVQRTL